LDREGIPPTYIPFRNANLLSIATSWAEVLGAGAIAIGAVEEDSSGYPDCREVFYEAFQRVIDTGTRPQTCIQLLTPVIHFRKSQIVRAGAELGVPFHLTWSCYSREDIACGECDSCLLRLRGFREAGLPDPLPYARLPQWV
ncbi:MAG: 7-cyano-7-deazaguanine synthase, partial [Candidatus Kapabacteria bacterium]|nr:7-cyano-7-deazaguanine synthase [Candidatus Kapabacteria bacterium]MDW7996688.1 7-cyano-7-deazaguanine synthase [Bacteroidota bacterium]